MNRYLVIIAILLGITYVMVWAINLSNEYEQELLEETSISKDTAAAKEVIINETDNGVKSWEVSADSATYNSKHEVATLKGVKGKFFNHEEKVIVEFFAPSGKVDKKRNSIELSGGTTVKSANTNTEIESKKMVWKKEKGLITSMGKVSVKYKDSALITGDSVSYPLDLSRLEIAGNTESKLFVRR